MIRELDPFISIINMLCVEDPEFVRASFAQKNKIYTNIAGKDKKLPIFQANSTFNKFLLAFGKTLNECLTSLLDPIQSPIETIFRKFFFLKSCKIEPKKDLNKQEDSNKPVYTIHMETSGTSWLFQSLEFLKHILEETPKPEEILKVIPDLTTNLIHVLKLFYEMEGIHDFQTCKINVEQVKSLIYQTLQAIFCEYSLYTVRRCIANDTLKSFFSLFEVKQNKFYFQKVCDILKFIGKAANKENCLESLVEYLQKQKYLLYVWKYLNMFKQNYTIEEKTLYLDFLQISFQSLTVFPTFFIDESILKEILLIMEVDLISQMVLIGENNRNSEACLFIDKTVMNVASFTCMALKVYPNATNKEVEPTSHTLPLIDMKTKGKSGSIKQTADQIKIKNTIFIKLLIDILRDKNSMHEGWHYLLKAVMKILIEIIAESLTEYQMLKTRIDLFQFCLELFHVCNSDCFISLSNVIQFIIIRCPEEDVSEDLETLSTYIRKIEDNKIYLKIVSNLLQICERDSNKLDLFTRSSLFKTVLYDLALTINQKDALKYPEDSIMTIISFLSMIVEHKRENLFLLLEDNAYKAIIGAALRFNKIACNVLLEFIVKVIKIEIEDSSEHPITTFLLSFINNPSPEQSGTNTQDVVLDPSLKIYKAIIYGKLFQRKKSSKLLIKKFNIVEQMLNLTLQDLPKLYDQATENLETFMILDLLLKQSEYIYTYFAQKLRGFQKMILGLQELFINQNMPQKINLVIGRLIIFSMVQVNQDGSFKKYQEDNFSLLENNIQKNINCYFICYPQLFKKIYTKLIENFSADQREVYYRILNRLLDNFPLNFTILNSCGFIETWYQSLLQNSKGFCIATSTLSLVIKFIKNAPSLPALGILSDILNSQIIDTSLHSPDDMINSGTISIEQSKKIFQELLNSISKKKSPRNLILSFQPFYSTCKFIWIPHVKNPQLQQSLLPTEKNPLMWNTFTIFSYMTLDFSTQETNIYPLFLVFFEIEKVFINIFIKDKALVIQIDQLETLLDQTFCDELIGNSTENKASFCLGISINLKINDENPGSIDIFLNGRFRTTLSINPLLFKNIFKIYGYLGDIQVMIGGWQDKLKKNVLRPIGLGSFMLFSRKMDHQEIQDLYMTTLNNLENWFWCHDGRFSLDGITVKGLGSSSIQYKQVNSFPYSSAASFEETIYRKAESSFILDSLVVYINPCQIKKLDTEDMDSKKILAGFLRENTFFTEEDKKHTLETVTLGFLPNLIATDSLLSSAILIGNQLEEFTGYRRESIYDNLKENLINIISDSSILDTMLAYFLNKFKSRSIAKSILKIFEILYKQSQRIRRYMDQKDFLKYLVGILEILTPSDDLEEMIEISQGFMVKNVPESFSISKNEEKEHKDNLPSQEEEDHWILYSKNAFIKVFNGLDLLSRVGEKCRSHSLKLIKNKLLREENFFRDFNIISLRSIKFPEMLIDGIVLGKYQDITDHVFDIITTIIKPGPQLPPDFNSIRRIAQALDFLCFIRIPSLFKGVNMGETGSNSGTRSKKTSFDDSEIFSKQSNNYNEEAKIQKEIMNTSLFRKDNISDIMEKFAKKYLSLTQKDLKYAENTYYKLIQILLSLTKAEFRMLEISEESLDKKELKTILLNTLFKHSHHEIVAHSVFNFLLDYLEEKQKVLIPSTNKIEDVGSSNKKESSKAIWTIFVGKNTSSSFKPATPKKNTETQNIQNFSKALLLITLFNAIQAYNQGLSNSQDSLLQTLDLIIRKEKNIFIPSLEDNSFISCALYLLIPLLFKNDLVIRQKVMTLLCIMSNKSVELIKKTLTSDKVSIFDDYFQSLLKFKDNPENSDFPELTPFAQEAILKIVDTKLKNEFSQFQEDVQLGANAEMTNSGLIHCLIPQDDALFSHALLFPKMHGQGKTSKLWNSEILSFFKVKNFLDDRKLSIEMLDESSKAKSKLLFPCPSFDKLKLWFDRALKPILHNLQKVSKNKRLRENLKEKYLKKYKETLFSQSLFDLNELNVYGENILEVEYPNYCWCIEPRNGPKYQKIQMKMKNISTSKKQYEREFTKEDIKDAQSLTSLKPENLCQISAEHIRESLSQDEDFDELRGRDEQILDIKEELLVPPKLKPQKSTSSDGEALQSNNCSPDTYRKAIVESKYNSLGFLSNDEGISESLFSEVGSINFISEPEPQTIDLGIDEGIDAKYNCLLVVMADKFQSVLIIAKHNLYICLNCLIDENGEILLTPENTEIDHSQWVLPGKAQSPYPFSSPEKVKGLNDDNNQSTLYQSPVSKIAQFSINVNSIRPRPKKVICIPYGELVELHAGRYLLKPCSINILVDSRKSYFLAFNLEIRNKIFNEILVAHAKFFDPKLQSFDFKLPLESTFFAVLGGNPFLGGKLPKSSSHDIGNKKFHIYRGLKLAKLAQRMWLEGDLSNFEYLSLLNLLAGRTYNDLSQYPVFPWIVTECEEQNLEFNKPENFRDLTRPMGAITKEREEIAKRRYQELKEGFSDTTTHHFGSHYSSPGILMYYFVRLFPFSEYAAKLQGGHFDFPDRLFNNLPHTLKLAMSIDYKELSPEFFTLPEFLLNLNYFNFGVTQQRKTVDNVLLPKWTFSDPRHFIGMMRRALESDHATKLLNFWIDLIFGYKQRGKKAYEATNLFHVLTYEDSINLKAPNIPLNAILTQINEFGQCPRRLFFVEHPHKKRVPADLSLFHSNQIFDSCILRPLLRLPSRVIQANSFRNKRQITEIKIKGELNLDKNLFSQGLGSFRKVKMHNNDLNTIEGLSSHVMCNTKGFLFGGENYKKVINWSNIHDILILCSSETNGKKVWTFSDERFNGITCAYFSSESNLLFLGNKRGTLMSFYLEEKSIAPQTSTPTNQSPNKEDNSSQNLKTNNNFKKTNFNLSLEEINVPKNFQELSISIAVEFSISGVEINNNSLRNIILNSFINKEKYRYEDFSDINPEITILDTRSRKKSNQNLDDLVMLEEYSKFSQYDKAMQKLKNSLLKEKKKSLTLKQKNILLEAHRSKITSIVVCNVWGLIITGDDKGICRSWDLEKGHLRMESYTYHFQDLKLFKRCWYKGKDDKIFLEIIKKNVEREAIINISVCISNGDFAVISKQYVSVYTMNHVLIGIINTVEAKLPNLTSVLLTKNIYAYEDNYLICGHKETMVTFWVFKKSLTGTEFDTHPNLMQGVFSHRYDKSVYINKIVKLNDLTRTRGIKICQAFENVDNRTRVASLTLSNDQTKLLIGLDNGEIYFIKTKTDELQNPSKNCNNCGNPIGTKVSCSCCHKVYCQNCTTNEKTLNFINLWKKVKLCPICFTLWSQKPENGLYNFY